MMDAKCDVSSLNMANEAEGGDVVESTKLQFALTSDGFKELRESSVDMIVAGDKIVEEAVHMFFSNCVKDAEDVLAKYVRLNPLCAAAAACISSVKAMLSMNPTDVNAAMELTDFAIAFARELVQSESGFLSKMGSLFKKSEPKKRMLPGEFRAKTVLAEAHCLRGVVLQLQANSFNNLIGSAMSINRCYQIIQTLTAEMEERKREMGTNSYEDIGFDRNSVYSVMLVFGCSNVIMSILPPRVLSVLNLIGFTYNREMGMKRVLACLESNTLLSPFAGLFLMTMNTFLPGFCPPLVSRCVPDARSVAEMAIKCPSMNESLIHLWMMGRICRLEQNMDESIAILSNCLNMTENGQVSQFMPQLRDVVMYDQAWNHAASLEWESSVQLYSMLEKSSPWLKMFYAYSQGCCYEMLVYEASDKNKEEEALAYMEEASKAFWRAAHYGVSVLSGRSISIDVFVAVRLNEIFSYCGVQHPNPGNKRTLAPSTPHPVCGTTLRNIVPLAFLELLVVFDVLHQVPKSILDKLLLIVEKGSGINEVSPTSAKGDGGDVDKVVGRNPHNFTVNGKPLKCFKRFVLEALKAILLCNLAERRKEAHALLDKTLKASNGYTGRKCSVSWVASRVLYEQATLAFMDGDMEASSKLLGKAQSHNSDQVLHPVMDTKLHFFAYALRTAPATPRV